ASVGNTVNVTALLLRIFLPVETGSPLWFRYSSTHTAGSSERMENNAPSGIFPAAIAATASASRLC
ncbi:hypothetical protein, partial [Klebsiella pneumoniae]|uniref:hypothetical protein n=1 Tax=Klebsiella pneumoniae TaxID=573 RepID=UPI001A932D29